MRSTTIAPVLPVLPVLWAAVAVAQTPAREHTIELEDYFGLGYVTACTPSPDGGLVAYAEMRWEPDRDARNTDLWQVDLDGQVTRLTFDPAADEQPRWDGTGRFLYFTSARAREGQEQTRTQVWRVPAGGGEAMAITRAPEGVDGFDLSADGRTLYYTQARRTTDADRWKALRDADKALEYGHGVAKRSTLWALDLSAWRERQLIEPGGYIRELRASPDGRRIAMITAPTERLISHEGWSAVEVHELESGRSESLPDALWRAQAPSPYGWIQAPAWSDDGQALAFRVDFDGYPARVFVARFVAGGPVEVGELQRPGEVSVGGTMAWRPGTRDLCFIGEDRGRARVYCVRDAGGARSGAAETLTPGDVAVDDFGFSSRGDLTVLMRDPSSLPDVYIMGTGGGPVRRLSRVNPQVETWKLPTLQVVRWTSDDGTPVEGILELPPDHRSGDGPLPTLVQIHGGPTAASLYALQFSLDGRTLFPARGWAVFSPNYRGSTGYGDGFLTDLIGHENDRDVRDILSGVDMLVREGIADPGRLAVSGWSNGGYLTNCLITRTDRFKAASSGAGVFDMTMQWAIEDTPGHVINYMRGLPWERAGEYQAASPLAGAAHVVTPTLIHVGAGDERVPAAHSRTMHRALHHYLDVPCELIVYPGAGHGLSKLSHRRAKLKWDVAWMEYWVNGRDAEGAGD